MSYLSIYFFKKERAIMEVDLILAIVYDASRKLELGNRMIDVTSQTIVSFLSQTLSSEKESSNRQNVSQGFKPFETANFMPNFASLWCDPNWSGMSSNSLCLDTHPSFPNVKCSLFRFQGNMSYLQPSALQKPFVSHYLSLAQPESISLSLCNSFKCHFFLHEYHTEESRQFLYSSSFPLISDQEKENPQNNWNLGVYGLFNYNFNEDECSPIPHVRLVVHKIKKLEVNRADVKLLALSGPTSDYHREMICISNWFQIILQKFCPKSNSSFINTRTLCRDYGNCPLFQHLPYLFQTPTGSTMPSEILFYVTYNSVCMNCVSMQMLLENLQFEKTLFANSPPTTISILDKEKVENTMRFIRDILAPWTLCVYEGLYWSDCSLNQNVEDQPFPMSFLNGNRIFKKDDCEGRVSEAQQIVLLLKSFYLMVVQNGARSNNSIWDAIQHMSHAYAYEVNPERSRLQLEPSTWNHLVSTCYILGYYFFHNIVELHTTVGDVNFASFTASENIDSDASSSEDHDATKNPTGHSFGVLIYSDYARKKRHAAILEATGWERTILSSDSTMQKSELELLSNISKLKEAHNLSNLNICGHLSHQRENSIYQNICLGNDCLFFTKTNSGSNINYGAKLSLFKEGNVVFHNPGYIDGAIALQIPTLSFINEMDTLNRFLNKKSTKTPTLVESKWIDLSTPLSFSSWKKALRDIDIVKEKYQRYVSKLAMHRRCLATPQRQEEEYLHLIQKNWKIMKEQADCDKDTQCRGIFVSVLFNDSSTEQRLTDFIHEQGNFRIASVRPFMHSKIFNIVLLN